MLIKLVCSFLTTCIISTYTTLFSTSLQTALFPYYLATQPNSEAKENIAIAHNLLTAKKHNETILPSILNETTALELSLLCNKQATLTQAIFPHINYTKTASGAITLQQLLASPTTDIALLTKRQQTIRYLVEHKELYNKLSNHLSTLAQTEHEIFSLWKTTEKAVQELLNLPYFTNMLAGLNNNALALESSYLATRVLSPTIALASPVILSVLFSVFLKAIYSILPAEPSQRIVMQEFGNPNIFTSYQELLRVCRRMFLEPLYAEHVNYRPLASWYLFNLTPTWYTRLISITLLGAAFYSYYKLVTLSFNRSTDLHKAYNHIAAKLKTIQVFITTLEEIITIIKQHQPLQSLLECPNLFHLPASKSQVAPHGSTLAYFTAITETKNSLIPLLDYIGSIDCFVSLATLYQKYTANDNATFCFPTYLTQPQQPILSLQGFWHPLLNPATAVTNSLRCQLPNKNFLITGPNAGGKSTILKSIAIAAILAQTISLAPVQQMSFVPFALIRTYLNIADQEGHESLFQAEMNRICSLLNEIEHVDDKPCLLILDELFTGTNPKEGAAAAYGVLAKLGSLSNVITLSTTHFHELTTLEEESEHPYNNYHVAVEQQNNGTFFYPYKLIPGISNQAIALELLKQKNLDPLILHKAHQMFSTLS